MLLTTSKHACTQRRHAPTLGGILAVIGFVALPCGLAMAESAAPSNALYGDWRSDAPGQWHWITPADLPAPFASAPIAAEAQVTPPPAAFLPKAPEGFRVERFLEGLGGPRAIRVAPNGVIFIVEATAGAIRALRPASAPGAGLTHMSFSSAASISPTASPFIPRGRTPNISMSQPKRGYSAFAIAPAICAPQRRPKPSSTVCRKTVTSPATSPSRMTA